MASSAPLDNADFVPVTSLTAVVGPMSSSLISSSIHASSLIPDWRPDNCSKVVIPALFSVSMVFSPRPGTTPGRSGVPPSCASP